MHTNNINNALSTILLQSYIHDIVQFTFEVVYLSHVTTEHFSLVNSSRIQATVDI